MLAGERLVSLRIDLNMAHGDRIMTGTDFLVHEGPPVVFHTGQIVRVVEEEGDAYLAAVEAVAPEKMLVYLRILVETWQPYVEFEGLPQPAFTDVWESSGPLALLAA